MHANVPTNHCCVHIHYYVISLTMINYYYCWTWFGIYLYWIRLNFLNNIYWLMEKIIIITTGSLGSWITPIRCQTRKHTDHQTSHLNLPLTLLSLPLKFFIYPLTCCGLTVYNNNNATCYFFSLFVSQKILLLQKMFPYANHHCKNCSSFQNPHAWSIRLTENEHPLNGTSAQFYLETEKLDAHPFMVKTIFEHTLETGGSLMVKRTKKKITIFWLPCKMSGADYVDDIAKSPLRTHTQTLPKCQTCAC